MKKIISIFMTLVMFIALVACGGDVKASEIIVNPMPKTVYYVGEELEEFNLTVKFSDGTTKEFSSKDDEIEIEGFDSTTPTKGKKRSLTIKYASASLKIDYEVKEAEKEELYAGGDGTSGNPYLISNPVELANIKFNLDKHFKLTKDIDLKDVNWIPLGNVEVNYTEFDKTKAEVSYTGAFSGVLDGDNHKIINYNATSNQKKSTGDKIIEVYYGFFYAISGTQNNLATVKNITFDVEINDVESQGLAVVAGYAKNAEFNNVTVTGSIRARRASGIAVKVNHSSEVNSGDKVNFVNVTNDVDITAIGNNSLRDYTKIGGLFETAYKNATVNVTDSKNTGNLVHEYSTSSLIANTPTKSFIGAISAHANTGATINVNGFEQDGAIVGNSVIVNNDEKSRYFGYKYDENGTKTNTNVKYGNVSNLHSVLFGNNHDQAIKSVNGNISIKVNGVIVNND